MKRAFIVLGLIVLLGVTVAILSQYFRPSTESIQRLWTDGKDVSVDGLSLTLPTSWIVDPFLPNGNGVEIRPLEDKKNSPSISISTVEPTLKTQETGIHESDEVFQKIKNQAAGYSEKVERYHGVYTKIENMTFDDFQAVRFQYAGKLPNTDDGWDYQQIWIKGANNNWYITIFNASLVQNLKALLGSIKIKGRE